MSFQYANALGRVVDGGSSGGGGTSTPAPSQPEEETASSSSSSSTGGTVGADATGSQIVSKILTVAGNSSCASYSWKDRGRAPKGYIKGIALSYARSLCRLDDNRADRRTPASLMARAATGNTSKDALAHYRSTFDSKGLVTTRSGEDTLRSLYTLAVGFGMRESSGKYCEGYDVAAGTNRSSSEAEAGLFQTSYNSISASAELKKLYNEYSANKNRCQLNVYKEGVTCKARAILGSGAGAAYQKLSKECPAFATEYAMVMLRVLRKHYGPINRKEAEVTSACANMLDQVENLVLSKPSEVCSVID